MTNGIPKCGEKSKKLFLRFLFKNFSKARFINIQPAFSIFFLQINQKLTFLMLKFLYQYSGCNFDYVAT